MGNDDCECYPFQIIFEDNTKQELGPAYEDWSKGKVDIDKVWRPNKKLLSPFLPDCCQNVDYNFTDYYLWPDHVALLVIWHVVSFIVLYLWWREKDRQPLRFRSFREILGFWLVLDFIMCATVSQVAAGFTASCILMLFVWDMLLPPVLVFYIVKPLQFIFIHRWNQAKKNNATIDTIKWFYERRWILTSRFVYFTMLLGALPGFILFITNLNLETYSGHDVMYSSLRCEWWQIPEQYQVMKDPTDVRCQCIFLSQTDSNDPAYPTLAQNCLFGASGIGVIPNISVCAYPWSAEYDSFCNSCGLLVNDPTNCGACFTTVQNTPACGACLLGDETQCNACLFAIALTPSCTTCTNVLKSKSCTETLSDFYVYGGGACGFFAETPSSFACKFCLASNTNTMAAWAAYQSALMLIILVFLVALSGLQDQLWLREELIAALPACVITIVVVTAGLMDFHVHAEYKKTVDNYSLMYGFIFAWLWTLFTVSFIMPTAVCYYYKYLAEKQEQDHKANANDDKRSTSKRGTPSEMASDADTAATKPRKPRKAGLQKLHEEQVLFAISNQHCREIYSKFAAEEFTIENVKFLVALHELRQRYTSLGVPEMLEEAKTIYETYIKEGAPVEVNVPDGTKGEIGAKLGDTPKRARRVRSTRVSAANESTVSETASMAGPAVKVPESSAEIMEWFSVAFDEIVELIVRDSWGRFTASSMYPEFTTVFNSEVQLDKSLGRVDGGPSRRLESERKGSKASGVSRSLEIHDDL